MQFHPSYGYEDFMEGLRPVTQNGQLNYAVKDGIFKQLCDLARAEKRGVSEMGGFFTATTKGLGR